MKRRLSAGTSIRVALALLLCLAGASCKQQDPIQEVWKRAMRGEYEAVRDTYIEIYGEDSGVPESDRGAVSTACIESLAAMGDDGAINALVDMLETGLPLGYIIAREINGSGSKQAIDRMFGLVDSPEAGTRQGIASGAGSSRPREIGVLCRLARDESPKVRATALYDMPNRGSESTIRVVRPVIVDCLDDRDPGPRRAAVTAFARLFEGEAGPVIRDALNDGDYSVREIGFQWLHLLPREEALMHLRRASESKDAQERKLAARAANMPFDEATAICEKLSEDPSDDVKWWLAYALRYPAPGKEHILLKLAKDPSAKVRAKTAEALYGKDSDDAREALRRLLRDHDDEVAHAAASRISWTLDEYWRRDLLEVVARLAKSSDSTVRYGAAHIIGDTSLVELEDTLVGLVKDRSPRVRAKAHRSLYSLNPARLRQLLGL